MRLCFLYTNTYAPYSKWFGTAFRRLPVDDRIQHTIELVLVANCVEEREDRIVEAQALVADMHNASGLTDFVEYRIEGYFGRDIKVIFADKFAEAATRALSNTPLAHIPRIGIFSQIGGLSALADEIAFYAQIASVYGIGQP